jgi:hypothetical protein
MGKEKKAEKKAKETEPPEGGKYEAGTGSFYSSTQDVKMEKSSTGEPFTSGGMEKGSATEDVKLKKSKKPEQK